MGPRASLDGCGKSRPPPGFFLRAFFSFFRSVLFIHCVPFLYALSSCHSFFFNTNMHVPGGTRTRNPSKRSAINPRLRPLGHWYQLGIRSLDRPVHSESLYRLSYRSPHYTVVHGHNHQLNTHANYRNLGNCHMPMMRVASTRNAEL